MKLFITLLLFGLLNVWSIYATHPKDTKTGTLNDDFQDFKKILLTNADEIIVLFGKYFAVDEQFRKEIQILYGPEMKQLIQMIDKLPEFAEFVQYLYINGITEIYVHLAVLHEVLNVPLPPYIEENLPKMKSANKHKREMPTIDKPGLKGFIENVKVLIDFDALQKLYDQKLETSIPFQNLVAYLKSDQMLVIVRAIGNNANYKIIIKSITAAGVDVERIQEVLHKLFGW